MSDTLESGPSARDQQTRKCVCLSGIDWRNGMTFTADVNRETTASRFSLQWPLMRRWGSKSNPNTPPPKKKKIKIKIETIINPDGVEGRGKKSVEWETGRVKNKSMRDMYVDLDLQSSRLFFCFFFVGVCG